MEELAAGGGDEMSESDVDSLSEYRSTTLCGSLRRVGSNKFFRAKYLYLSRLIIFSGMFRVLVVPPPARSSLSEIISEWSELVPLNSPESFFCTRLGFRFFTPTRQTLFLTVSFLELMQFSVFGTEFGCDVEFLVFFSFLVFSLTFSPFSLQIEEHLLQRT